VRDHEGAFSRAHDGVLFLDEVAELPGSIQTTLLRVLEDGIITPLGDHQSRQVNVRILSATNKDLKKEVEAGRFRQDLYYRLVVAEIVLPPLRERQADIPLLVWHFYAQFCERHGKQPGGISPELMAMFEGLDWPGNVRELENTIERLVAMAQNGRAITAELLPEAFLSPSGAKPGAPFPRRPQDREAIVEEWIRDELMRNGSLRSTLEGLERKIIAAALEKNSGNITRASRDLGLPRQTLQSSLKRLGLLGQP